MGQRRNIFWAQEPITVPTRLLLPLMGHTAAAAPGDPLNAVAAP